MTLKDIVSTAFSDLSLALTLASQRRDLLIETGSRLADRLTKGGTIFICGNGGSASMSSHLATELVSRFLIERPGLPAKALTADTATLTAIGNDYSFAEVFSRQVRALGRPGDVLWGLSTSGTSPNVLKALAEANSREMLTLFMCGPKVHDPKVADIIIPTPGATTPRIQEIQLLYGHTLCHIVESLIFEGGSKDD